MAKAKGQAKGKGRANRLQLECEILDFEHIGPIFLKSNLSVRYFLIQNPKTVTPPSFEPLFRRDENKCI